MARSVSLTLAIVLLLFSGSSFAQNRADVTIMVPNYDVLFLGDIVDITTGKLRQTIPCFPQDRIVRPVKRRIA